MTNLPRRAMTPHAIYWLNTVLNVAMIAALAWAVLAGRARAHNQ